MGIKVWLAASAMVVGACLVGAWAARDRTPPPLPPPPVMPHVPVAPPQPNPLELLQRATTLRSALAATVPEMADSENEGASPGAAALAIWMASHKFWEELMRMPDTKRAEVMKDSDATRGRRICVSGTIIEIHRDKSTMPPIYNGGLSVGLSGTVRFYAVGDTSGVIEHAWARLCGIISGTESYSNSGGGVTHSVHVVGAFDPKARPTENY